MSAITGCYSQCKNKSQNESVEIMLSALRHRFHDRSSLKDLGHITFGYGAFHTTHEESSITSPFSLDGCSIVLDGRVDNRKELIHNLGLTNQGSRLLSDHEIILRAYQRWNEGCLENIFGDFSFAIWDGRRLLCGRDRFGVKPFNFFYNRDVFTFASEAKALLELDFVDPAIDEEQLCYHFVTELLVTEQRKTLYKNIRRLPPAHGMIVDENGLKQFRYWNLDSSRKIDIVNEKDCFEGLTDLLKLCTRDRMRSSHKVGTALSGGLDSTSVTCLARDYYKECGAEPLHTFSCLFNNAVESDEREWINSVVDEGGIIPHFLYPEEESPMFDIEDMLWLNEGPFYGGNYYLQRGLYNKAREQGIRVFLDGEDGDGTISHGYDYLMQLAQMGNWKRFFCEAEGISEQFGRDMPFYSVASSYNKYARPYLKSLLGRRHYVRALNEIQKIHKVTNASRKKLLAHLKEGNVYIPIHEDYPLVKEDLFRKYSISDKLYELNSRHDSRLFPQADNINHYEGIVSSGSTYLLEQIDRVSSFYGIELRHPFFDHRLAEYCLALPSSLKLRGGYTRFHFREAMKGILPEKVRWRGGKGDLIHQAVYSYRKFCDKDIEENALSISKDDPVVNKEEANQTIAAYINSRDDSRLMESWNLATYGMWRKKQE